MFTKEQMRCVWGADVVSYLSWRHAGEVKREGQYLRLKSDRKVVFHGNSYYDNGTGGHGGPVDALVKYFGYTPVQAIEALTEGVQRAEKPSADGKAEQRYAEMPKPAEGRYSRVYAYLTSVRGIPAEMVNELMRRRLLYQDERGNAVFINPQGDTAEIRGTGSFKPFKSTRRTKPGGMWYYEPKPGRKHVRAYVCESAIDCISLYLLIGDREAVYVSSAGTGNAEAVAGRIARHMETVICTDNDEAGNRVRERCRDLTCMIPRLKDWNDDWRAWNENDGGNKGMPEADCGGHRTA